MSAKQKNVASPEAMDESKVRILHMTGWLLLAAPALYLILLFAAFPGHAVRGIGPAILLVLAVASLLLLRAGRASMAARLLVYAGWSGLAGAAVAGGGVYAPQFIAFPLAVVLAGWMLGPRHAIAVAALSILLGLALAVLTHLGRLTLPPPAPPFLMWVSFTLPAAIICLLTLYIVRSYEGRLADVRRLGTELTKRIAELAAEKNQFHLIAENVPAMIAYNDRGMVLRYANSRYLDFFGRDEDALGRHIGDLIGAENYRAIAGLLEQTLAGNPVSYRTTRRNAAGEMRAIEVEAVPDHGPGGEVHGTYAMMRDITEQRRAEDKFHKVFHSNPLAVSITRLSDGRYVDVNDTWLQLFGWSRDEVVGRTSLDLGKWVRPGDRAVWAEALRQSGRVQGMETRFHTRDGAVIDVLLSAELIDLADEQCALIMVSDNTERKRAEKALSESEAMLRIAVQGGNIGLWEWDVATDMLRWNKRLRAIFGLAPDDEDLTLPRFLAAIHPDDVEATRDAFRTALANNTEFDKEYRIVWPDGTVRWVVARGQGAYAGDGKPLRMTGAALDITARKEAEEAQRESQERFAKIFEASPIAISVARFADGAFFDVNPSFVRMFGWTREELIGCTSTDIALWPSVDERMRWVRELGLTGRTREYVVRWRNKSGDTRICLISAERIRLVGEECILAMISDITDRMRVEEELKANQARLIEAQRIGHFGSWELDIPSQRMTFSDELHRIYERDRSSFGGTWQDLLNMVHPDDLPAMKEIWRKADKGGSECVLRHRILMPDGRIKHLFVRFEVFLDAKGNPAHALGTAQDITEQVLAREEVQRLNAELEQRVQERTAELTAANRELESFAYSISHDLRAPLRGIDGFSKLLADEYRDRLDDDGIDYLDRVRRAAQRMGTLIDDILELSRVTRQEMRRVRVDLSQIAAEVIEERSRAEPGHRVAVTLAPDCTAHGDPQLLRVLMQNLLENAWKYSAKKAAPAIEFGRETIDGEPVFFVRDNGIGFDMKYADRLFTPFQRLHRPEEFEGTGIGLATVARIIRRHGGRVWAESSPDQGTTLRFAIGDKPAGQGI